MQAQNSCRLSDATDAKRTLLEHSWKGTLRACGIATCLRLEGRRQFAQGLAAELHYRELYDGLKAARQSAGTSIPSCLN
jgi:hypothetical protein